MKPFGRGRGRMGPHLARRKVGKSTPIKVKTEKLRDIGHLVSPDKKKTRTFTIKQVIQILKEQNETNYQEQEMREMLKIWRIYKCKPINNIYTMQYTNVVTELQQAQSTLVHQDNDFAIDEVVAILKNQDVNQLKTYDTEDLRELLRVWKTHNKEETKDIKRISHNDLIMKLEGIKTFLSKKMQFEDK